jgi:hypothetical protein
MSARFVACAACSRHVKEGDAVCPFCGAAAPRVGPLPRLVGVRMTRAAMIAAGTAGTVAAILDCGQTSGTSTAFYGVACTGSECLPGDQDAAPVLYDGGSSAVFYGVACTGDACPGIEEDAGGGATDAAKDATTDAPMDAEDAGEQ